MRITLSVFYDDRPLAVSRLGDVLVINDEPYDFGPLPAGATLPSGSVDCMYIVGAVDRDSDGILHLTLLLPIQRSIFHDPLPDIVDPEDGPIELPVIVEPESLNMTVLAGAISTIYGAPDGASPQYLAATGEQ